MFFVLCIWVLGCSNVGRPIPITGIQVSTDESSDILDKLQQQARQIISYRGLVQARLQEDSHTQSFRYVLVFRSPDDFRLEVLPSIGAYSLQLMVARAGTYSFIDINEKQVWQGSDVGGALARLLRLRLTPSELITYLTGRVPESILTQTPFTGILRDEKAQTITLVAEHGVWVLDSKSLVLKQAKLMDNLSAKTRLDLSFGSFSPVQGFDLPAELSLKIVESDLLLKLKPQAPTLNRVIEDKLFELVVPHGYALHREN